jgi:hypothetical protein
MSEFKKNMSEFLHETITMIEVGLGPSGELRYPAYRLPWEFKGTDMGVGEFQVSGIILCKSSATCNQALFQRNHMEQDSYAQEDLCSV